MIRTLHFHCVILFLLRLFHNKSIHNNCIRFPSLSLEYFRLITFFARFASDFVSCDHAHVQSDFRVRRTNTILLSLRDNMLLVSRVIQRRLPQAVQPRPRTRYFTSKPDPPHTPNTPQPLDKAAETVYKVSSQAFDAASRASSKVLSQDAVDTISKAIPWGWVKVCLRYLSLCVILTRLLAVTGYQIYNRGWRSCC